MRPAHLLRLILAGLALAASPLMAHAQDVTAAAPHDVSVTIYRDPYRQAGGFDLNQLGGFAFITETRRVVIPPGEHRLRFEGVADGIEPASAIVTGLPSGVIEKNRDAALISPLALIEAAQAQDGRVVMTRSTPGTGVMTRTPGRIRSGADGGVVFETPEGIEALRCSGLPETVSFTSGTNGLSARPTLSVLTRTTTRVEAVVQLSYLARGFDWAADYTIDMKAGGKLDLGGWVTLANGNGTGFPNARVQVVAGRLNRDTGEIEPIDIGQPILALCWPQGSTSDPADPIVIERAYPLGFGPGYDDYDTIVVTGARAMPSPAPPAAAQDRAVSVFAMEEAEDLGDLKLYRVPQRTTVASRQSKQVRLLDKPAVPIEKVYEAQFGANQTTQYTPLTIVLRTRNDTKNKLGLPLPSGRVAAFETAGTGAAARRLLAGQTNLRDLAINEEVELRFPGGPDVQVRQINEGRTVAGTQTLPFLPGFNDLTVSTFDQVNRIELTNAHPYAVQVEVRLFVYGGQRLVKSDHPVAQKDGRPIFRVSLPANSTLDIRYQTAPP